MTTWEKWLIVIAVINLIMSIFAFIKADNKGQDPMSAFMATMIFGLLGFILVYIMDDRKERENERLVNQEFKSKSIKGDALIFYSEITGRYHLEINGAPVGEEDYDWAFNYNDIKFVLRMSDDHMTSISKDKAKELLNLNR